MSEPTAMEKYYHDRWIADTADLRKEIGDLHTRLDAALQREEEWKTTAEYRQGKLERRGDVFDRRTTIDRRKDLDERRAYGYLDDRHANR